MRSCYQFLSFCEVVLRFAAVIDRAIINDKEEYFKWEFSQIDEKVNAWYVLSGRQGSWDKKRMAGRAETLPAITRFGRTHPIMTCTKWQVGCRSQSALLPAST